MELIAPVDCVLGADCFVFQHVDRDPSANAEDFRCKSLSYDGHKGVDFALPTLEAMETGVDVVAAANGRVVATRDGMPDVSRRDPAPPSVEGRECGNGVLLDHGDGWMTQYCHMKRGTIAVTRDSLVRAGERLGSIGLSGDTEFPHLHLQVRRGDTIIDPFDGRPMEASCDPSATGGGLWAEGSGVAYAAGGAVSAGIVDKIPAYDEVNASAPNATGLPGDAPALVHWASFFGLQRGDVIESQLRDPSGAVLAEERYTMPKHRIRQFRAIGRRKPEDGWRAGTYTGFSRLVRGGAVVDEISTSSRIR